MIVQYIHKLLKKTNGGFQFSFSVCTHILHTSTVINDNDIEGRILPPVPAPEEVPSNATKPVDRHLQFGHCLSLDRS